MLVDSWWKYTQKHKQFSGPKQEVYNFELVLITFSGKKNNKINFKVCLNSSRPGLLFTQKVKFTPINLEK